MVPNRPLAGGSLVLFGVNRPGTGIVPGLAGVTILDSVVGLRAGRPEVRIEVDYELLPVPSLHNYGHGESRCDDRLGLRGRGDRTRYGID